ncbi:MAG: hypothetical protein KIS73_07950 [Enhydrobacter sp.]|nr:hypothetical protein [Enhydrobacter sp.]
MLLGACSTIIEGRHQQIVVNTNPSGADCGLYRQGIKISTVQNTPGNALIEKTKHDIWVVCVKQGYQQATYFNHSGAAGATFGNIILGGGIGWAIDSASGADNKYDSPLNISLVPAQSGVTEGPATLPNTYVGTASQPAAAAAASAQKESAIPNSSAPVAVAARPAPSDVSAPVEATPVASTPSASQSALDGQWLVELTLNTSRCPDAFSASAIFSGRKAEGSWGSLRMTSDGDVSGWVRVSSTIGGSTPTAQPAMLSGQMAQGVVKGTVSGGCLGTFRMTRS